MSADPSSPRLARPGSKISCVACRESKIRCLDNDSQSTACRQCSRKGLQCTYPARLKPGRRPKDAHDSAPRPFQPDTSIAWSPRRPTLAGNDGHIDVLSHQAIAHQEHAPTTVSPDASTSAGPSGARSRLDMSLYLEPSADEPNILQRSQTIGSGDSRPHIHPGDPITHDLLSFAEAELLLRLFFDNLNPMISLFDQALHTLDYLRSTSSALTSAILAMSAKFFRPDLHLPILRHYHTISSRALNSDECSTALVQSLMVDVYWKEVKDVSAWRKTGAAIRMGYQMRWHDIRKSPLPASEHEARVILDAERTWLCLVCFDSTYSSVFGLPMTIQRSHYANCLSWAQEHLYLHHDQDTALAFVHETGPIVRTRELLRGSDSISTDLKVSLNKDLAIRARSIQIKWFEAPVRPEGFDRDSQQHRLWWILNLQFSGKVEALHHEISVNDTMCLEVIELVGLSLDVIERLSERGVLRYMQDAAAAMLSRFTAQLVSIYPRFALPLRASIISPLRRLCTIVAKSAQGDPVAPTAFVARYVHHALETLSMRSRVASPLQQPAGVPEMLDQSMDQLFTENLSGFGMNDDQILSFSSAWGPEGSLDSQYWASLFPSLGEHAGTFPP